jgi:hypothetical protein
LPCSAGHLNHVLELAGVAYGPRPAPASTEALKKRKAESVEKVVLKRSKDGTNYNQWKHCMNNYLYSISPEVWQVVCDGVDFLDEDD